MKEFLTQLGIDAEPVKSKNGIYVIDIADSDEYGKFYSKLDKSDLIDEIPENSQITYEAASIQYEGDDYTITLMADFENDVYKMTIKEI